jgi:hypothetical protein
MTTANLDADDLGKVPANGWVNEDVMQQIFDISKIELPFTQRAGTHNPTAKYSEWTQDKLAEPDTTNAKTDGQDTITANDAKTGKRLGNYCQISTKTVQISTRAQAVDSIGNSGGMGYQLSRRADELRRDVEAIALTGQGSDEGDAEADSPSKTAGVFAFLTTNVLKPSDATLGGFKAGSKHIDAIVPGTKRKLTETMVRDVCEMVYLSNGNPNVMMARPKLIRKFSEYCFTADARIGTLMSDIGQDTSPSVAKGAVTVFESDFGIVLQLIPNRIMPEVGAKGSKVTHVGIFDFEFLKLGYLKGYKTEPLAKTGLSDKSQISVDWQVRVHNEEAEGAILTIDETLDVTQA